jgi:hypothetical protein
MAARHLRVLDSFSSNNSTFVVQWHTGCCGSKEETRRWLGDRGGHGQKMGRSTVKEDNGYQNLNGELLLILWHKISVKKRYVCAKLYAYKKAKHSSKAPNRIRKFSCETSQLCLMNSPISIQNNIQYGGGPG